jgi:Tetratricopeptide repeat
MRGAPLLPFVLLGVLLTIAGIALVALAHDPGAAAVSLLGIVVSVLIGWMLTPSSVRRGLLGRRSQAELRADLLTASREDAVPLVLQSRPPHLQLAVELRERVQASTRRAHSASTAALLDIFDAANGRFVMVGAPGSGKTTAAVSLLQSLLERSADDDGAPIPVFVSLASWPPEVDIEKWLQGRVRALGSFTRAEAAAMLPHIVPILDGLDEVAAGRRIDCARAIASHAERYPRSPIIVCAREEEYGKIPTEATSSLPAIRLEPLTAEAVSTFLNDADATHWRSVVEELGQPSSPLAGALSTALMVAVTVDVWSDDDPKSLVTASREPGATVESVSSLLWRRWVELAARRGARDSVEKARSLAAALEQVGSIELRPEELGGRATLRTWTIAKVAQGCIPVVALRADSIIYASSITLLSSLTTASTMLPGRLAIARIQLASIVDLLAFFAPVGLLMVGMYISSNAVVLIGFGLAAAVVLVTSPPTRPFGWLRRRLHDPFRYLRGTGLTALTSIALGAAATGGVLVSLGVSLTVEIAVFSILMGIGLASYLGFDTFAHHWIARAWYGRAGLRLRDDMSVLVQAGFLRPTGDAFRFFHRELQRHLATPQRQSFRYEFENANEETLFTTALESFGGGGSIVLWKRYLALRPSSAAALGNLALNLQVLGRFDEAEEAYLRALKAHPRHANNLANFAVFLWNQRGDVHRARRRFEDALKADPTHARAVTWYGLLLVRDGLDLDRAYELLQRAQELNPSDEQVREGLAAIDMARTSAD